MKKVFIPSKVWTNINDFVNRFPFTKSALVAIAANRVLTLRMVNGKACVVIPGYDYIYVTRSDMKYTRRTPDWNLDTGYTSLFQIRKKIRAYEDMVHYALSPEKYINYNFEIAPMLGFNIDDYPKHNGYPPLKIRRSDLKSKDTNKIFRKRRQKRKISTV